MLQNRNKIEKEVFSRGYTIDNEGNVYNPKGEILCPIIRSGYPTINIRYTDKNGKPCWRHIKIARLQAYKHFGEAIFNQSIVVRHLNGNKKDSSIENIAIGTMQDNMLDIPKEERIKKALNGAKVHMKYEEAFVETIRKERQKGAKYKDIMLKYSLPKSTVSYIINHNYLLH